MDGGLGRQNVLHSLLIRCTDYATYTTRTHFNSLFAGNPLLSRCAGWRKGDGPVHGAKPEVTAVRASQKQCSAFTCSLFKGE